MLFLNLFALVLTWPEREGNALLPFMEHAVADIVELRMVCNITHGL